MKILILGSKVCVTSAFFHHHPPSSMKEMWVRANGHGYFGSPFDYLRRMSNMNILSLTIVYFTMHLLWLQHLLEYYDRVRVRVRVRVS